MKRPPQYFRAGVGAAILNNRGLVLALERADIPGAWQLPQGGLRASEDPLDAVRREVAEETGIRKTDLRLLDTHPEPLAYELPADVRTRKTGRGQVQYWFLFRFGGTEETITVEGGGEFRAWKWVPFDDLLGVVAPFRRHVYQGLAQRFRRYFRQPTDPAPAPTPVSVPDRANRAGTKAGRRRRHQEPSEDAP